MRILVVEDDPSQRSALIALLELESHTPVGAGSLKAAGSKFADLPFDLVLLDYNLRDAKAPQVVARIREIEGDRNAVESCPIVFISGSADLVKTDRGYEFDDHRDEGARLGVVAHVEKPIDLDELLRVIEAHGRKRRCDQ